MSDRLTWHPRLEHLLFTVILPPGLDFSLDDIAEILALRDRREARCRVVLDLLQEKDEEISRRIAELRRLKVEKLRETIFPYLTNAEGLKLVALSLEKDVALLSCCAG